MSGASLRSCPDLEDSQDQELLDVQSVAYARRQPVDHGGRSRSHDHGYHPGSDSYFRIWRLKSSLGDRARLSSYARIDRPPTLMDGQQIRVAAVPL